MTDQPTNPPAQLRHVPLAGTFNLRDTGGYATTDGSHARWHQLWRSDSMHRLSAEDQQTFLALGIRTVIDLRHERETTQSPNVFANSDQVHYVNIPLMPTDPPANAAPPRDLTDIYVGILEACQPAVKSVIETVLAADSAPVLLHGTAGKVAPGR